MEGLDQFLEQLMKDKGLTGLDKDTREQLKGQMAQTLMDQIDRAAIDALPEDKAVELADKMDDPNFTNEDAGKFLQESGVDLQQVALNTMVQFRQFYLRGATQAPSAEAVQNEVTEAV